MYDEIYECVDCGHKDELKEMHSRSHGGWDCPKCCGELMKPENIWREDDTEDTSGCG